MEFKKWFFEMAGATTADIGHIILRNLGNDYDYHFTIDDRDYEVNFKFFRLRLADTELPGYGIDFRGPQGWAMPGDTRSATAVYAEVIKAIRKLIEMENPEQLRFYGASEEQDFIYDKFYKRYLSRLYTRIGTKNYLRNDLYNKYKQANGPEWRDIEEYDRVGKEEFEKTLALAKTQRMSARAARKVGDIFPEPIPPPVAPTRQHLNRGDRTPGGGVYVGTAPNGVVWVAYNEPDFYRMAQTFDSHYQNQPIF